MRQHLGQDMRWRGDVIDDVGAARRDRRAQVGKDVGDVVLGRQGAGAVGVNVGDAADRQAGLAIGGQVGIAHDAPRAHDDDGFRRRGGGPSLGQVGGHVAPSFRSASRMCSQYITVSPAWFTVSHTSVTRP